MQKEKNVQQRITYNNIRKKERKKIKEKRKRENIYSFKKKNL